MIDEDIFAFLLARVEETKKAYEEAKQRFWSAAGKPRQLPRIPSALPDQPRDGELARSVTEERSALQAHILAMTNLNQYS